VQHIRCFIARRPLDVESAATLVHALVTSRDTRVDYCNAILAGASKSTTDKPSESYECRCSRRQRHAELRSRTHQSTSRYELHWLRRSRAGAVQAVLNGLPMSAAQGTTVGLDERLLHPHLGHCSSAAPAVR